MRAELLVVLLGCGSASSSLRPSVLADPELEHLAFLDGCWASRHADYGSVVCFWREGDGWAGSMRDHAPPLPSTEWALRIVRDRSAAIVLAIDPLSSGWDGPVLFAHEHAEDASATFAAGDLTMSFSRFGGRLAFSGPYDGESDLLDRLADPSPP